MTKFRISIVFFGLLGSSVSAFPASTTQINQDGKLHIYFCGTGDPEPIMQNIRRPSCLAMIVNNDFFLFDAGEASITTLAGMKLPYGTINKIFMTHWHSDHFAGLGQIFNVTWYNGHRNKQQDLYGPYGIYDVLNGIKKSYKPDVIFRAISQNLDPDIVFPVPHQITATANGTEIYSNKDLNISAFEVDHKPVYPALGYRIQYKGCKIVISGDTKIVESLANNAKNADILINEALNVNLYVDKPRTHYPSTSAQLKAVESYHSSTLKLAQMAHNSHVKHLFLTHFVPAIDTTKEAKQKFMEHMNKYYSGPITAVDDRDELIVESTDSGSCLVKYVPAQAF